MPELLGYPLTTLVLYFCFYSFAGWAMETVYCSLQARHFVARGFLHGPVCPIYGVGVLLMILFFQPLAGNIVLFYVVSTVCMSAWEYFVGWFLEVTTHMKYWDYSDQPFNLHGRICLWVCLVWGALSYVCVFWVHPPVARLIGSLPALARDILALVLTLALVTDAVITVRELALMTRAMNQLRRMGDELQRAAGDARVRLQARRDDLIAAAERTSRRFRRNYADFRAPWADEGLRRAVLDKARQVHDQRKTQKAAKKSAKSKK